MTSQSPTLADPSLAAVSLDPNLPNVLLIGDSISMGYTLPVRERLKGAANVHRPLENGGPITNGLSKIDRWLGSTPWKVIHFNFGLHDLKIMPDGVHQVPLEDYEKLLETFTVRIMRTGARLIWASTTPVPTGRLSPKRIPGDEVRFNQAAERIMKRHHVKINDLHSFVKPHLAEWQRPANVHFNEAGSNAMADQVAGMIREALALRTGS